MGDALDEDDERFFVNLSDATNAVIAKGQGTGTILDDDASPSLSIADADVTEGNSGTRGVVFTVTLSSVSGRTVTVDFDTADGTAVAPADYAGESGTLEFAPGETTATIEVAVKGDTQIEPDETFAVELSDPGAGSLGDAAATGTIVNDDSVAITIDDATVTEGNPPPGTRTATLDVRLSAAAADAITVAFGTTDGTARAGTDYSPAPAGAMLTFAPGETTKTISVTVNADTTPEPNETFFVTLSNPVNAVLARARAKVTIVDDGDESGDPDFQLLMTPSFQVIPPGGSASFAVSVVGLFGFTDEVTLTAPVLPPGITSAVFSVNPLRPTLDAPSKTSILTLTAAPGSGEITVVDFVVRGTAGNLVHEISAGATRNSA